MVRVKGYNVHYVSVGQGVPMILIHGAGEHHRFWGAMLNDPPPFYRVLAVDLPGHGYSTEAPQEVSIEFYAEIVAGFVEALGLEKPVLVGHSMGGAVVQTLGVEEPDAWRALVLAHTGAKLGVLPEILEGVEREPRLTIREHIIPLGLPPGHPPRLARMIEELMMQNPKGTLARDFRACDRFDIRHLLSRIRARTLIVGGFHDRLTPLKWATYLNSKIHDSRLTVLGGCGHYSMVERPVEFSAVLKSFLDSLRRRV